MKTNRVSEEKMLNDLFVLLEYSDSFKELVKNMPPETRDRLENEIKTYHTVR